MVRKRRRDPFGDNLYLKISQNDLEFPESDIIPTVTFFLGAGASKFAGVPDTKEFVIEFLDYLKQKRVKKNIVHTLQFIIDKIKEQPTLDLDVEIVMEVLERLKSLDGSQPDPVISIFIMKDLSKYKDDAPEILEELRKFIRQKGMPSTTKVRYFGHLLNVDRGRPLKIFTVNYDTCIEQMCEDRRLKYSDGFELRWDPTKFSEDNHINLYKLHGSVIWYRASRAGFVKLPLSITPKTNIENLQLMGGEKLSEVILYPTRKDALLPPMFYLMNEFGKVLVDWNTKLLILVGYSFRDEYIRDLIWEGFRTNPNIRMILISPSSKQIYEEKLAYYGSRLDDNPSSVYDKVVALPMRFEDIVENLDWIVLYLQGAFEKEEALHQDIERGRSLDGQAGPIGWMISSFIDAGALEHATKWFTLEYPLDLEDKFGLCLKLALLCAARDDESYYDYFNMAIDILTSKENVDSWTFKPESWDKKTFVFTMNIRRSEGEAPREIFSKIREVKEFSSKKSYLFTHKASKIKGLEGKIEQIYRIANPGMRTIDEFTKDCKAQSSKIGKKLISNFEDYKEHQDDLLKMCNEIVKNRLTKLKFPKEIGNKK